MKLLKKADVKSVVLQEEKVDVPELGGAVIVRSPCLADRLALSNQPKNDQKKFAHLASLLAVCVLDGDGQPIFTVPEWEAFGAKHLRATMALWDKAWQLSDFDGEQAKKNAKAPT